MITTSAVRRGPDLLKSDALVKGLPALVLAVGVVAAGAFVAAAPLTALVTLLAGAGLAVVVMRPALATAFLVASFYFEGYLTGADTGLVTGSKLVGLIAVTAFAVDRVRRPRALVGSTQLWILVAFSLWIVLSTAGAYHRQEAFVSAGRYIMFIVLFFLVLQVARDRHHVDRLIDVVVLASGVAALLGLLAYLSGAVERASGPLENPNDFAFLLGSTVPLALYRLHRAPPPSRLLAAVVTPVLFAAILTSYSRAALVGLAAAGMWALLTRGFRARWCMVALAGFVVTGLLTYQLQPDLVRNTFENKQRISAQNVDTRATFWRVALEQTQSSPLYGIGPGNYVERYAEREYPLGGAVKTTHNAYLDVLAELGIPGLLGLLGFLGVSWSQLRRRSPWDLEADRLRRALAAGFVVAVVGALFMTEQYYPPIWFLAALGASLAGSEREVRVETGRPV